MHHTHDSNTRWESFTEACFQQVRERVNLVGLNFSVTGEDSLGSYFIAELYPLPGPAVQLWNSSGQGYSELELHTACEKIASYHERIIAIG